MSISTPPPPTAPKKTGWGCLGCGCGGLLLIVVVAIGLLITAGVVLYHKAEVYTSTTQLEVPDAPTDPAILSSAQKKLATFQHDVQAHQPASLHLNSEELSSLVAANPDIQKSGARTYITLSNDTAHVQASAATDKMIPGLYPNRYVNLDTTFTVTFNSGTKSVVVTPQTLQVGSNDLLESKDADYSKGFAKGFSDQLNQKLRANGNGEVLDRAKTITIKDSELVIETE